MTSGTVALSRAFLAVPVQVGEARRFMSGVLGDHPAADDAVMCVSEMAANAAIHSKSREPGGHFMVRAQLSGSRIRVEVQDQGGQWSRPLTGFEPGHGLHIIGQLAQTWGIAGDSATGWVVWAEIACP
jgi:anti-sigma regulatory factor (Ser/Thr protein kinase)